MTKFLGRAYDINTDSWVYQDGSGGSIHDECRIEVNIAKTMREVYGVKGMWLLAFGIIQRYKNNIINLIK